MINVGNNSIQTSPSEESLASRSVTAQVELAALKPRQQDSRVVLSREIDTRTSHPRKTIPENMQQKV